MLGRREGHGKPTDRDPRQRRPHGPADVDNDAADSSFVGNGGGHAPGTGVRLGMSDERCGRPPQNAVAQMTFECAQPPSPLGTIFESRGSAEDPRPLGETRESALDRASQTHSERIDQVRVAGPQLDGGPGVVAPLGDHPSDI